VVHGQVQIIKVLCSRGMEYRASFDSVNSFFVSALVLSHNVGPWNCLCFSVTWAQKSVQYIVTLASLSIYHTCSSQLLKYSFRSTIFPFFRNSTCLTSSLTSVWPKLPHNPRRPRRSSTTKHHRPRRYPTLSTLAVCLSPPSSS
jgi:hypothetical protein